MHVARIVRCAGAVVQLGALMDGKASLVAYCSPEAIQALANAAAPGGVLVGRKTTALRVAAVEGLRLAGASGALKGLAADGDKAVREAARAPVKSKQPSPAV